MSELYQKNVRQPKSIKINMVLNSVKGMMSVIFPLITFPYISRVLGVENIGKYNFATSIISCFSLIAALGVSSYARRDGAVIREDRDKFEAFSNEIFTINILTTAISYVLLFVYLAFSTKARDYSAVILVLSLSIVLTTIGVEWVYTIFEDYFYITVRSILFQVLSMLLLFVFVKDQNDLIFYAWISVISSAGSNILNFFHARKYCKIHLTRHLNLMKHIKPLLIFFAANLSVTIYVSSDTVLLGYLCSDYHVGLYSVSVKIYNVVKSILCSVIVVSISRLSLFVGERMKKEFTKMASDVYRTVLTLIIPAVIGLIMYRKEIILLVSGKEYIEANESLALLAVAMLACALAYFWGQCVVVPHHFELYSLKVTMISALINVVLNFILIPRFAQNAAAFTTIISEGFSAVCFFVRGRKLVRLERIKGTILKILAGCIVIVFLSVPIIRWIANDMVRLVVGVLSSAGAYFLIEIALKNDALSFIFNKFKK